MAIVKETQIGRFTTQPREMPVGTIKRIDYDRDNLDSNLRRRFNPTFLGVPRRKTGGYVRIDTKGASMLEVYPRATSVGASLFGWEAKITEQDMMDSSQVFRRTHLGGRIITRYKPT